MQQLNGDLPETLNIHEALRVIDSQSGAQTGVAVSLKGYAGALVVLQKEVGTAGDDVVFTLKQGTDVAFATNKALTFERIYSKLHATTVPGLWTKTTQTAGATYTDDTSAEKAGFIAVDIKADMLDRANGYDCIRLDLPDTGAGSAQLTGGFYILYGARYSGIAAMLSPIAD